MDKVIEKSAGYGDGTNISVASVLITTLKNIRGELNAWIIVRASGTDFGFSQ